MNAPAELIDHIVSFLRCHCEASDVRNCADRLGWAIFIRNWDGNFVEARSPDGERVWIKVRA